MCPGVENLGSENSQHLSTSVDSVEDIDKVWNQMLELVRKNEISDAAICAALILTGLQEDNATPTIVKSDPIVESEDVPVASDSCFVLRAMNRVMATNACRLVVALAGNSY